MAVRGSRNRNRIFTCTLLIVLLLLGLNRIRELSKHAPDSSEHPSSVGGFKDDSNPLQVLDSQVVPLEKTGAILDKPFGRPAKKPAQGPPDPDTPSFYESAPENGTDQETTHVYHQDV